jgi:hypothetical protein
VFFDQLDGFVAGRDVDARARVRQSFFVFGSAHASIVPET